MSPNADVDTRHASQGAGGPAPDPDASTLTEGPRLGDLLAVGGVAAAVVLASSIAVVMFLA